MPNIIPFVAVAVLLIIVPGADMALVTKNTISRGRSAGFQTVAGVIAGVLVHGTAAVIGLSAIIAASSAAFQTVKIVGAVYLIFLGVRAVHSALRAGPEPAPVETAPRRSTTSSFAEGLVTNVLNPKLVVFFLSLMPQFINEQSAAIPQIIVLSLVFTLLGTVWLVFYVAVVDQLKVQFQRPALRRCLDALSGTVLIALGLRLVVSRT